MFLVSPTAGARHTERDDIQRGRELHLRCAHYFESIRGPQSYSIFFNLKKDKEAPTPAVRMFVKSAYLKPLVAKTNAQNWRFVLLACQIAEAFPPREKKQKPMKKKKKAP